MGNDTWVGAKDGIITPIYSQPSVEYPPVCGNAQMHAVAKSEGIVSAFFPFIVSCCITIALCFGPRNMQRQKKNKAAEIEGLIGVPKSKILPVTHRVS